MPDADASQWVDATMPNVPANSGLVVKVVIGLAFVWISRPYTARGNTVRDLI
jgi:hypothetical protein